MSKEMSVIALGIWIIVIPYLGVPGPWRTTITILSGLALIIVGFFLRTEALMRQGSSREHRHFVDNASMAPDPHTHDRKEGISSLN